MVNVDRAGTVTVRVVASKVRVVASELDSIL